MMATFFALLLLLGAPFQNLLNKSRYPLAFPRDGAKKVMQTDRVIVWDYTWTPNKPTPICIFMTRMSSLCLWQKDN